MATLIPETETRIVITVAPEILGPESAYEKRRIALRNDYQAALAQAERTKEITTLSEAETVANLGRILQAGIKEGELFFTPIKDQINKLKAPILEHEHEFCDPLASEKKRLGSLATAWEEKCRREQEERDRKAREEAERQAREEQLARAVELDEGGDHRAADQVLKETPFVPAVTQSFSPSRPRGQVGRTYFKCRVTDLMTLVKAVAKGKAPIQALQANQQFLDGQADQFKEGFSMPGCQLDKTASTHFRS